jgi:uncharacterized protein
VEPDYLLGNIHETHLLEMVASPKQRRFGDNKRDQLTRQCQTCEVRPLCNGGCPKDRFVRSRDGEPGHNYLCAGLYHFFNHVRPAMEVMAYLIQHGEAASRVMEWAAIEDSKRAPNARCPCGSGKKFKDCHGRP